MLERRKFLALMGATLAPQPSLAEAGSTRITPRVGVVLGLANDVEGRARAKAFEQGLEDEGWSIGKNLQIDYRFSSGKVDSIQAFADEFIETKPNCIVAQSTPVAEVLIRAIRTIPIVFVAVTDPVGSGFVKSMSRPGGNATGFTVLQATITGKYLAMLKQMTPRLTQVAIIYNPDSAPGAGSFFLQPFLSAAKGLGIEPVDAKVHNPAEIESALAALGARPGSGLIVMPDNFTSLHRAQIISLAAQYKIPAVYPYRYFAEEGGLLAYGVDTVDMFRRAADYVSRILRGAKPSELPVQAPNKFELVINLKTAHALGLTVPRILLASANVVVE